MDQWQSRPVHDRFWTPATKVIFTAATVSPRWFDVISTALTNCTQNSPNAQNKPNLVFRILAIIIFGVLIVRFRYNVHPIARRVGNADRCQEMARSRS